MTRQQLTPTQRSSSICKVSHHLTLFKHDSAAIKLLNDGEIVGRNYYRDPCRICFKQQIEEMHATEVGGFAPDIEAELRKAESCDLMIWQFPLWWFGLPAILKGWVDRVFAMGRTYGRDRLYENGVFKGKRALLSVTTGGPREAYQPGGFNGDIDAILRPIHRGMLRFTGWDVLEPNIVYGPVRLSQEERAASLNAWATRLRNIGREMPIEVGKY
jgi:NAD(P)H dehydrogenase (quinone)